MVRSKIRRQQANSRERHRMHGLNAALDRLREHMPITSKSQKLSKIETLRLARNYIGTLTMILGVNEPIQCPQLAKSLSRGLSHGTSNLIAGFLNLNPRTLVPQCQQKQMSPTDHFHSNSSEDFNMATQDGNSNNGARSIPFAVFEPGGILKDYYQTQNTVDNNFGYRNFHQQSVIHRSHSITTAHQMNMVNIPSHNNIPVWYSRNQHNRPLLQSPITNDAISSTSDFSSRIQSPPEIVDIRNPTTATFLHNHNHCW